MTDRDKFMVIGGVVGGALGAVLAWAYYQQQTTGLWTKKRENNQTLTVQAGPMEFLRIAMAIFGVAQVVQALARPKK